MSLQACADIVAKGDRDRFAAAMAAPVDARQVLFPIYAFNVEVARAPWAASEPMIGEMRLQWWRDVLDDIAAGKTVSGHEVSVPLSDVLDDEGARLLSDLVAARRWDLYTDAFEDTTHFNSYLEDTGGNLMWATARALGANTPEAFRQIGRMSALANLFLAIPELEKRGRKPLPDGRPETVARLATDALNDLKSIELPRLGRAAALSAWRAKGILTRASKNPGAVAQGALVESEFSKRFSLLRAAWRL